MLRILSAALTLAVASFTLPAHAATLASFDTEVGVSVSASPGQEVWATYGYLPSPGAIFQSGDTSLTTGDDNGTDTCCFGPFDTGPGPFTIGTVALSAEGAVNSVGQVNAAGQRLSTWTIGNAGNTDEAVTVTFDIEMAITQAIDPSVGGTAASETSVFITLNGTAAYDESLAALIDEFALGAANSELFTVNLTLAPGETAFFTVAIGGSVDVVAPAPIPLPAGMLLLGTAIGALALGRRHVGLPA